MKKINPQITLLIIIGVAIIAATLAYYGALPFAVTECNNYFTAEDEDGDTMPFDTRFEFYEWKDGSWTYGGSYTIPNAPLGRTLWLRSDTRYKAVPEAYEGWKTPSDNIFYGCSKDCTFVYERIVCTPGFVECEGDVLYKCNPDGTDMVFQTTCAYGCSGGVCNEPPAVPCSGLPECSSTTGWYQECCDDKIWTCYWNNYDGAGYRFQWELHDTCDADCTCDESATEQSCWCADLTPDCSGLGVCSNEVYLCDECCEGDVWECSGHYKWELKEGCTSGETCECTAYECLDCDCVTIATATPTPTATPAPTVTPTPDQSEDDEDNIIWIIGPIAVLLLILYFKFIYIKR